MASDPVAQREIDRLKSEIDRLRDVERHLRRERDRVRSEATSELERLQSALREAAAHAGAFDGELAQRDADATAREEALSAREAEVEAATQRVRDADARLEEERRRLEEWRKRLESESERLAEWERSARLHNVPAEARQVTFEEGLQRLADPEAARRSCLVASSTVLLALSSTQKLGIGLMAAAFVVFALISAMLIPRYRPDFPARHMGWFIAACVVFTVGMLATVAFVAKETEHEASAETHVTETEPSEPPPAEPPPTETAPPAVMPPAR